MTYSVKTIEWECKTSWNGKDKKIFLQIKALHSKKCR